MEPRHSFKIVSQSRYCVHINRANNIGFPHSSDLQQLACRAPPERPLKQDFSPGFDVSTRATLRSLSLSLLFSESRTVK